MCGGTVCQVSFSDISLFTHTTLHHFLGISLDEQWSIRPDISHLLYFMHRPEWTLTVIICPLKATREIMAHNSLSMYF